MKLRVPRQYDAVMDWVARHVLPPNRPIGLRVRGYDVTWLDLALVAYPTAAAIGLWAWTGSWLWLPAVALCMALTALVML